MTDARLGVLYVSSISGIGGAELCLAELIEHLDRDRCAPLLYVEQPGPLVERLAQHGTPIVQGSFPFFRKRYPLVYWRAVWRLRTTIRRHNIAVVHVNCDRAVPIAVTAARLASVPCVCYIHDLLRAWYLPKYVKYLNAAQCIAVNSRATAERCVAAGMQEGKIRVIYPPIQFSEFAGRTAGDGSMVRQALGLPADAIVVGIIGKISRNKGHEELVRAFAAAVQQQPALRLLVVGDSSMTGEDAFPAELAQLIQDLGIESRVTFGGLRNDIPAVMRAIDLLAVPSRSEAFGRSAAEALAAGVPVIASDVDGLPEVVQHNVTGLLTPPKDVAALTAAIVQLGADPGLRRRLGDQGPAAAARFDIAVHVREFMRLYAGLAAGVTQHGQHTPRTGSTP